MEGPGEREAAREGRREGVKGRREARRRKKGSRLSTENLGKEGWRRGCH